MIQVFCKNTNTSKSFQLGTTLMDMIPEFKLNNPYPIVSAKVNNVSQGLKFKVYNNRDVEFVDIRVASGMRVYTRSLSFLFTKAVGDVMKGSRVYIEHPISNGLFCNIRRGKRDNKPLTAEDVAMIRTRMEEIVARDMPFHRYEVQTDEAIRVFSNRRKDDKVRLLESIGQPYTDYYTLGDTADYYYGRLVPSAGYLTVWGLEPYHNGVLLRLPDRRNPLQLAPMLDQPKTFAMFNENRRWNNIMRLANAGDVNILCQKGNASELIQVAEALQEKKIVQIAEAIEKRYHSRKSPLRLVLITGPSSSGKSTFCKRLSVQLKACGLRPLSFSTDDYFVNRVETPKFPDGSYDFDNFDTVDHAMLQSDLLRILNGEEVEIPEYNFVTGLREYNGKKLKLGKNSVVLVEGLHALNPRLSDQIPDESKFRIFINTLTGNSLDNHNFIPTADNRLLRRIIRDYNKGAFTAQQTIDQWPMVLDAEEKWIYPYQENADAMFNSAYLIEFAVLRNHAIPILDAIPKNIPAYSEAHRLLKFLHYFTPVSDKEIPPQSMMREFVGRG